VSKGPEHNDPKEREKKLDQAIEMTFPASDPIAVGDPTGTEAPSQPVSTTRGEVRAGARVVTVFGGTGFLGRRIVGHLRAKGFAVRVASRHPKAQKVMIRSCRPSLRIFTMRHPSTLPLPADSASSTR
jgi:hypothetical protein